MANARLEPGEVVLLYTDGIIERPGRDPAAARAELARTATDTLAERGIRGTGLSAVDRVCPLSLELLVRQSGHTDDITLLAAQRVAAPEPLHLRLASTSTRCRPRASRGPGGCASTARAGATSTPSRTPSANW
ncbi:SpoIIE family protein phosphatase [Amycolatopsis sp. FDAARGOS 1241]|uniref:SpoIIE family protein phosphatase n=1 Tax=Amycolatopsis sp. FDAARGOS 1241 TaxID=2778070 RepID=UPI001950A4D4|nr:SpoIIE family protein phosphatase [Amycolatopsis sp. FDAARGOS 1241]QRP50042.1 SpoIIE family protein phosphatase [Amycolatopsis sp. FDAARGOS 1241]